MFDKDNKFGFIINNNNKNNNSDIKKYVDDNIKLTNTQTDSKINALNFNNMLNTGLNKSMTLAEVFPDLLNGKYDTVKQCKLTVETDGTTKINLTENYNFIQWQLYDNDNNLLSTAYSKSKVVRSIYFEPNDYVQFVCWLDATYTPGTSGSGINHDTPGYVTFMLSISKSKNTEEYINKIKDLRLTAILRSSVVLVKDNKVVYEPTSDYNPATKKYVDDNTSIRNFPVNDTTRTGAVVDVNNLTVSGRYVLPKRTDGKQWTNLMMRAMINDGSGKGKSLLLSGYQNYIFYVNIENKKIYCDNLRIVYNIGTTDDTTDIRTEPYYLTTTNTKEYTPTTDYHPTTKKYVDDKVSSLPQFSFNENGELVVKIGDTTKIFVPKE